jgi:hypothetical protein
VDFQSFVTGKDGEVVAAEDKLAATLYSMQSSESLYAENILGENVCPRFHNLH